MKRDMKIYRVVFTLPSGSLLIRHIKATDLDHLDGICYQLMNARILGPSAIRCIGSVPQDLPEED